MWYIHMVLRTYLLYGTAYALWVRFLDGSGSSIPLRLDGSASMGPSVQFLSVRSVPVQYIFSSSCISELRINPPWGRGGGKGGYKAPAKAD